MTSQDLDNLDLFAGKCSVASGFCILAILPVPMVHAKYMKSLLGMLDLGNYEPTHLKASGTWETVT